MNRDSRIYVAGHRGLVGSALVRRLERDGCERLILRSRDELDLTVAGAVNAFFQQTRPEFVFMAAARVGGILANSTHPVEFLRDNLAIELNVIEAGFRQGVEKLLFLGSSCIYPRDAVQPMTEEALLTGPLEPTNEWYAIAKIAGIKLCQAYRREYDARFISVMPTNLYGPNDDFDPETSHVLPALVRKLHEAKEAGAGEVVLWGTGTPRREFLHVDDLADACVFLMDRYDDALPINIGVGKDITIEALARMIASIVGYEGEILFDPSRPDGSPRKLLDVSRISAMGWTARTALEDGIRSTYEWYVDRAAPYVDQPA